MKVMTAYIVGFLLILVGAAIVAVGSVSSSPRSVAGVVFVGPIPIVFGRGPGAGLLALISAIVAIGMVFSLYLFVIQRRTAGTGQRQA